jgi:hypothetical protein
MFKRIPQPPVNPVLRAREHHDFWAGFVTALAAVATAWETQLIKAFSSDGLQYASQQAAPPPPRLDNVANPAEVLDRWARQQANAQPLSWKIRVDVGSETPCPT